MNVKTALSLIAAAVGLLAGQSFAQTPAPKVDRAAVKAEAASAVKSGETKAGEAAPGAKMDAKSTAKRADVKAETKEAVKKGETPKAGEAIAGCHPGPALRGVAQTGIRNHRSLVFASGFDLLAQLIAARAGVFYLGQ